MPAPRIDPVGDVIKTFQQAPRGSVITAEGGPLPLPPERREVMVGVELRTSECVVLVTPQAFGTAPLLDTRMLLRERGYKHVRVQRASIDVIEHIYEQHRPSKVRAALASGVPEDETDVERIISDIVQEAYEGGASDIHLETRQTHADVYFRINGTRKFIRNLTMQTAQNVANTLYTHADPGSKSGSWNPDIPKDGSIPWNVENRTKARTQSVQLRFSSGPMHPGGNFLIVIRVLSMEASAATLGSLGFEPDQQEMIRTFVGGSGGLVIICGPVNSGKSTTIQATLKEVKATRGDRISVQTVEDPVEYVIPGGCQMPVSSKKVEGRSLFNEAVKSKLRQDGDILMIGEIRDGETAGTVTELVLSGRKLLTTIHSYSGIGVFLRLREMGVPWDIMTTPGFLHGIVYQRLIPLLCQKCAVSLSEEPGGASRLKPAVLARVMSTCDLESHPVKVRGDGCDACNHTGLAGRTVVSEFVVPDRPLLQLLAENQFAKAEAYWHKAGVLSVSGLGVTALAHGIHKMRIGLVDPQDLENNVALLTGDSAMEDAKQAGLDAASSAQLAASERNGASVHPLVRRRGM